MHGIDSEIIKIFTENHLVKNVLLEIHVLPALIGNHTPCKSKQPLQGIEFKKKKKNQKKRIVNVIR